MVSVSSVTGNVQFQTGNGAGTSISVSGSTLTGNVQIQTGNGTGNSVSLTNTIFNGNPNIQMGNANFSGSVGVRLQSRLAPAIRARLVEPAGDAMDGALRLIRAQLEKTTAKLGGA